jgi:hypothetical protein
VVGFSLCALGHQLDVRLHQNLVDHTPDKLAEVIGINVPERLEIFTEIIRIPVAVCQNCRITVGIVKSDRANLSGSVAGKFCHSF